MLTEALMEAIAAFCQLMVINDSESQRCQPCWRRERNKEWDGHRVVFRAGFGHIITTIFFHFAAARVYQM
jgi:hypothetical protein